MMIGKAAPSYGRPGEADFDSPAMTKNAKFWVALLLIASVLFALRLCHPHTGEFKHQQETEPK
jgi:hypothetical protein